MIPPYSVKITQTLSIPVHKHDETSLVLRKSDELGEGTNSQNRKGSEVDTKLQEILERYSDTFAVCDKELRQTDLARMKIETGDHEPIKLKTRPDPLGIRAKLREILKDLEKRRVI
ncbi:unnamed protein product [Cylicostephanus goldi]|uniref:Uncharacterized protein n=1 Tax=Cylicostephanus goldi TaxID=71465 RepID=A0A3P6SIR5_CYLGO|nr:unnamed protein product [Cylicostephanus goldi]